MGWYAISVHKLLPQTIPSKHQCHDYKQDYDFVFPFPLVAFVPFYEGPRVWCAYVVSSDEETRGGTNIF